MDYSGEVTKSTAHFDVGGQSTVSEHRTGGECSEGAPDSVTDVGDHFDFDVLFTVRKTTATEPSVSHCIENSVRRKGRRKRNSKPFGEIHRKIGMSRKKVNINLTPVAQPRRFEEGLPVYKSFGNFSDLSCGQIPSEEQSRAPGKCPFDCWCCF